MKTRTEIVISKRENKTKIKRTTCVARIPKKPWRGKDNSWSDEQLRLKKKTNENSELLKIK